VLRRLQRFFQQVRLDYDTIAQLIMGRINGAELRAAPVGLFRCLISNKMALFRTQLGVLADQIMVALEARPDKEPPG